VLDKTGSLPVSFPVQIIYRIVVSYMIHHRLILTDKLRRFVIILYIRRKADDVIAEIERTGSGNSAVSRPRMRTAGDLPRTGACVRLMADTEPVYASDCCAQPGTSRSIYLCPRRAHLACEYASDIAEANWLICLQSAQFHRRIIRPSLRPS